MTKNKLKLVAMWDIKTIKLVNNARLRTLKEVLEIVSDVNNIRADVKDWLKEEIKKLRGEKWNKKR